MLKTLSFLGLISSACIVYAADNSKNYPTGDRAFPTPNSYPPNYPTAQQGYATAQQGYPTVPQGYPTAQQGYPTAQQGYATAQQGYPTAQQGYPTAPQIPGYNPCPPSMIYPTCPPNIQPIGGIMYWVCSTYSGCFVYVPVSNFGGGFYANQYQYDSTMAQPSSHQNHNGMSTSKSCEEKSKIETKSREITCVKGIGVEVDQSKYTSSFPSGVESERKVPAEDSPTLTNLPSGPSYKSVLQSTPPCPDRSQSSKAEKRASSKRKSKKEKSTDASPCLSEVSSSTTADLPSRPSYLSIVQSSSPQMGQPQSSKVEESREGPRPFVIHELNDFDVLKPFSEVSVTTERDENLARTSLRELTRLIHSQASLLTRRDAYIYLNEIQACFESCLADKYEISLEDMKHALGNLAHTISNSMDRCCDSQQFFSHFRDYLNSNRDFMKNIVNIILINLQSMPDFKGVRRNILGDYTSLLHSFYQLGFGLPAKYLRDWDDIILPHLTVMKSHDIVDLFYSHGKLSAIPDEQFLKEWYSETTKRFKKNKQFEPELLVRAVYSHGLLDLKPSDSWLQEIISFCGQLPSCFEINDEASARELLWANIFLKMKKLPPLPLVIGEKAAQKLSSAQTTISNFQQYVKDHLQKLARRKFNLFNPIVCVEEYLPKLGSRADGVIYAQKRSFDGRTNLQHIIVLEVDGISHMYGNSLNTVTEFRNRIYEYLGYVLIAVPYTEWGILRDQKDKDEYLLRKYQQSLKKVEKSF